MNKAIINGKTASFTVTNEQTLTETPDQLVKIEVDGKKFEALFQNGSLGSEPELNAKKTYKALYIALGGDAGEVEENGDRFDGALSDMDGWSHLEATVAAEGASLKAQKEARVTVSVRILPSLHKRIKVVGATTGRTASDLIESAIEKYLNELAD